MTLSDRPALQIVVYEGAGSEPLAGSDRGVLLSTLLQNGYPVTCTGGATELTPAGENPLLILGRFQAASLPRSREASLPLTVHFRNIDGLNPEAVLDLVTAVREQLQARKSGDWKPWFPVIDYSRCTNCMQCLSFCLFDVYGVSAEKKIQVQNPQNCKTDCPACSRVCPEVAILFPKYRSGPINGDEINEQDLQREKMKIDISALLGGDIYALLRERSQRAQSRFSKERDDERALKERKRCLEKLKGQRDVPVELYTSLPTSEEIEAKLQLALQSGTRQGADR